MSDGFAADVAQIRAHAAKVDAIQHRFAAVQAASAAISRDDAAYGLLCGWIAGILDSRHTRQDELLAYVAENLRLAADALVQTGTDYEQTDQAAAERVSRAGRAG